MLINRKYLYFRWLGADLTLTLVNAAWLSNVLKLTGLTTPNAGGLNARSSYTGAYGGVTPGGTLQKLVQNSEYELISGSYNWTLPTSVEVFNLSQTVAVNQSPTVTINGNASGKVGTEQSFQAIASDSDGTVAKVELLLMASADPAAAFEVLDTDAVSPYVLRWTPTNAGNFNLRTRATDEKNATSLSSVLAVQVAASNVDPSMLSIQSVTPGYGPAGSQVTVLGYQFGATQNSSTVRFNTEFATIISWSATKIVAQVPAATAPATATGKISVTVAGTTVYSPANFRVTSAEPFYLESAEYSEVATIVKQGLVEPDNSLAAFSTLGGQFTQGGSEAEAMHKPYTLAFSPAGAGFGCKLRVVKSFGGGTRNLLRFGWPVGTNGDWFGAQWDGLTGAFVFRWVKNGQEQYYANSENHQYNGVPVASGFLPSITIGNNSAVLCYQETLQSPEGPFDRLVMSEDTNFDFTLVSRLESLGPFTIEIVSAGNSTANFQVDLIDHGYLQGVNFANYAPSTRSDGSYHEAGGKAIMGYNTPYPSAQPGDEGTGIRSSGTELGVLNLLTKTVSPLAKVFTTRKLANGTVHRYGENAISTVEDLVVGDFTSIITTWATNGLPGEWMGPVLYRTPTMPRGPVAFPIGTVLNLPLPYGGYAYDTDHKRINGKWHIVYSSNNSQQFAIHHAVADSLEGPWELIASTTPSSRVTEGSKFVFLNGAWFIVSANFVPGDTNSIKYPVYDLNLSYLGEAHRTSLSQTALSASHYAPLAIQADGVTTYYNIVFGDETWYGAKYSTAFMHLYEATKTKNGYDFPVRTLPITA